MSSEPTTGRNRLVVPIAAATVIGVIVVGYLITRGGDETPAAPKPAQTTATSTTPQADLSGSGDAPAAIAVKEATVARSATAVGLAADLPDIDLKKFDSVTLVLGQDSGEVLWKLRTFRDSRGAFVTPEFFLVKDGLDEQFACAGSSMRIKAPRLTMSLPLACLDDPEKPLQARLEIEDRDGGEEKTSTSKTLAPPKP
ncbi:hypothetical protein [Aeromicrobium sp.]|uniref:hypothetical protein n=1 Tax=Aeromicrobium sp. TaxID=1871063 RepID=UPI0030C329E1